VLLAGAIYVLAGARDHPFHDRRPAPAPALRLLLARRDGVTSRSPAHFVSLAALGRRTPFRRLAYAAFLGYAFANSLPLSVVTGAAVRYQLYSQWGISARGRR
jgi:hypothetical protein